MLSLIKMLFGDADHAPRCKIFCRGQYKTMGPFNDTISPLLLESTNGMSSGTVKLTTWADNMGRPTLDSIQPLMLSLAALESDRY